MNPMEMVDLGSCDWIPERGVNDEATFLCFVSVLATLADSVLIPMFL